MAFWNWEGNTTTGAGYVQLMGGVTGSAPTDSQTRPNDTTAYDALDVMGEDAATNLTFADVSGTAGGSFAVLGASIRIDGNAIIAGMSYFRLHLYNAAPTAIADNVAYNLPAGDRAKYLGYIDISNVSDLGDTVWVQEDNINFVRTLAGGSTSIYGILQTMGAYTPVAETVVTVTLATAEV